MAQRKLRYYLMIPFLLSSGLGCSSMKTTFFTRHEDDTLCKDNDHPVNGVPVMLKIPSHLEIKVQEVLHIHQNQANLTLLDTGNRAIRIVEPQLRFTEKMFVVDPKRPFSGSSSYGFTFRGGSNTDGSKKPESGHGYLSALKYQVDDETITNATTLLASVAPLLGIGVSKEQEPNNDPKTLNGVLTTKRTIAYGIFDISSPNFEDDVRSFIELHVNQCNPCDPMSGSIYSQPILAKEETKQPGT